MPKPKILVIMPSRILPFLAIHRTSVQIVLRDHSSIFIYSISTSTPDWHCYILITGVHKQGTEAVRGLSFASGSSNLSNNNESGALTTWQAESLSQMNNLKLLVLEGSSFAGDFSKLPENLLWLRWWDFPYQCLPSNIPLGRLAVLDLARGRLITLWDEDYSQLPLNLLELNLTDCNQLQRVPKYISKMTVLQKVILKGCRVLTTLPQEFSDLYFLEHLDMSHCTRLLSLPNNFGRLKHLKHLDLSSCSKLKLLPDSFNQLLQIKFLSFAKCKNLNIGSNILAMSSSLEYMDFQGCHKVQVLPCNIASQRHLKWLYIQCKILKQLPEDLGELIRLTVLTLHCPQITEIPESLGDLIHLEYLDVTSPGLLILPESIGRLEVLKELTIKARLLSYLPDSIGQLNNLQSLFLVDCKALKNLPPSFENLVKLVTLDIYDAPNLRIHRGILDGLRSLELLSLYRCKSLADGSITSLCENTPALRRVRLCKMKVETCLRIPEHTSSRLQTLLFYACKNLVTVEICSTTLTVVELKYCHELETISGFSTSMRLTELCLRNCEKLSKVTDLGALGCLETLDISGCSRLFCIEVLNLFKQLQVLNISVIHETVQKQSEWLPKLPSPLELRISADSAFTNLSEGLSHVLRPFQRMEKYKHGNGLQFTIPSDMEMPCGAVIICFATSHLVNDRDDLEIMLDFFLEHDKRVRPVTTWYTKNADLIHLYIFSADIFWVRVMRGGDVMIIKPDVQNQIPISLGEGWAYMVPRGGELDVENVRNAFLVDIGNGKIQN